jgi:colanic acid/amylovoran biosynthesis glycosyltransferase
MKVTFCTRESSNLSGGQNTWLCHFLPELRRLGIEPRVICFALSSEEEFSTVRSLRQAGISCTTLSDEENKYTEQAVRWLLERLAENPPDVFVSNMVIPAAYYAGRWVREAGIPTVGICHIGADHFLYRGLLDEFVFGRDAYRVAAFVCVSKYLEEDVLTRHPKGILVRSIPCGVSIPKNVAKSATGQLRLAYVGRLSEEAKRISEVTHALCQAVREVPGTEGFMYGDGEERPAVEQILREEGDGLPVHLVGRVENDQIRKHLLKCHAVVLLSDWEGLGLSLLEGMACGLVPIGLRHARGGAPELIEDGVTGLLVDDRGDGFVAAVRRLREDPTLWKRLARSARAQVQAKYSINICAYRWKELLLQLANGSSRKPLQIPRRLDLPPVHPALAVMDERLLGPRPRDRLIQQARHLVSWVLK